MIALQARTLVWWIIKIISYPLFLILGPVKTYGLSKAKQKGPYLVICNHPSLLDPVLLFLFAPRPMIFLGAAEVLNLPIIKLIGHFFHLIPVVRGSASSARKALNQAVNELEKGEVVALFPEGETSPHSDLRTFHKGFLFIAKKANIPVQCVIVKNSSRVIPYGKYLPRPSFKLLQVIWGKQFFLSDYNNEELFLEAIQAYFEQVFTTEEF